ncbi:Metallo-dependent phosphatase-like protein [Crassisporium funariophilum]|nr:Metallo-dependent phosphatase-like protein [Crassisporium funariophilum]
MFKARNDGLDTLLQSRRAADEYSPLRRRYTQSPSLPFFLLSSIYTFFRYLSLPTSPQPHSNASKIRLVCISDTHNQLVPLSAVPNGDILIHAGDLTQSGTVAELRLTLDWLRSFPHTHKVVIAGNHDAALAVKDEFDSLDWTGLTYLCDEAVELNIRGRILRVFGSPWTSQYGNFAFQYPRNRAAEQWAKLPVGIDVFVTHGPPKAHVDVNGLGCEGLLEALWRTQPKVTVCGHVHGGRGMEKLEWDEAQRRWEDVIKRGKKVGWCEMLLQVGMLGYAWLGSMAVRKGGSLIVNCAVVGGVRDQLTRGAVVLDT